MLDSVFCRHRQPIEPLGGLGTGKRWYVNGWINIMHGLDSASLRVRGFVLRCACASHQGA
jgi:hypothetical protein